MLLPLQTVPSQQGVQGIPLHIYSYSHGRNCPFVSVDGMGEVPSLQLPARSKGGCTSLSCNHVATARSQSIQMSQCHGPDSPLGEYANTTGFGMI